MAAMVGASSSTSPSRAIKIPRNEVPASRSPRTMSHRGGGRLSEVPNTSKASETSSPSFSFSSSPSPSYSESPPTEFQGRASSSKYHGAGFSSLFSSPQDADIPQTPSSVRKQKGKAIIELQPPNSLPLLLPSRSSPLGPSMLSSQTYRSISLNGPDPDEPPRLITYTRRAQGFTWNDELFLPSYLISRYSRGRRKQYDGDMGDEEVEVAEIFISDEEARQIMPCNWVEEFLTPVGA